MYGLAVRWSLADAPDGADAALREYVRDTSLARFTGMDGLRFKTWRMRPGEWFEGTYVFETAAARDAFAASFAQTAAESPGSKLIGSAPVLQEPFEVVAVAEGGAGFAAGPGPT
ncbi:hypothetical protein [Jiangella anatolica]|uniref:Uncharacterized protein n=1 Tax=Jiangella anatolica TaxID=2670374 RepID=A0A2W2BXE1_9ACTN|nr:hypothetical protein [Jiangella anatolica]PZF80739.1 hypothetical protein C1I92_24450 [Jiangella anatolica]